MRLRFSSVFLAILYFALSRASLAQATQEQTTPMQEVSVQPAPVQERKVQQKNARAGKKSTSPGLGRKEAPTVITADKVEAKQGQTLEATGDAQLKKSDQKISADHFLFKQDSNELFADGSVKVEQTGAKLSGHSLEMNLDSGTGVLRQPEFSFSDTNLHGSAESMQVDGKDVYTFKRGVYTSCPAGNDDWLLKMSELELDRNTQLGTAYNARIEFMGVPILYSPWMNFPINDQRRSGLLGPTLGNTNTGGSEITVPIYLNLAENYDATVSPRRIEKRGMLYDNEFRYMGYSYNGKVEYGELREDKVALRNRSHSSLLHMQNFGGGVTGSLNLNEASDDAYFRDLSPTPALANQKHLLREGALGYNGGWWTTSARLQSYQTLQDPDAPVALPYRRLPQINLGAQRSVGGPLAALNAEYVEFNHPTAVNGTRVVFYPSMAFPLVRDTAYYVTPKIGLHDTQYELGDNNPNKEKSYARSIPITTLDSGLTLERDFTAYGKDYIQTLEPRIYYVNIPYKEQDMLPNFDTAPAAFSFVQMFSENRFVGNDRIGDADQVTTAVTSRWLDGDTGSERLRVAVGERFSRIKPKVVLGNNTTTTNQSDILYSVGGRVSPTLTLDSLGQYNPNESRTEMFAATARYRPEAGKVLNLGYRYAFSPDPDPVKTLRQVDASTQWPVYGRWHTMAQWKYSLQEDKTVERLLGLEYMQSCWTLRMVQQRFVTALNETSSSFFIQLELHEMVRVGTDPLTALKQSVPGYTNLSEKKRARSTTDQP